MNRVHYLTAFVVALLTACGTEETSSMSNEGVSVRLALVVAGRLVRLDHLVAQLRGRDHRKRGGDRWNR